MRRGLLGLLLVSLASGLARGEERPARDAVRAVERHMREVIDAAEASVVAVVVSHQKYPAAWEPDPKNPALLGRYVPSEVPPADPKLNLADPQNAPDNQFGSGVVLDATRGYVLTNYHLIDGATKVYVRAASGKGCYANIRAADARSDLAVVELLDPLPGLREARMADVRLAEGPNGERPTVARGTWVLALGHPLAAGVGDGSPSASWGILSNVRRRAPGPGREELRTRALYHYGSLLQTDARITLGCSGSALLNMDGELIGLSAPLAAVTGSETAGGYALPFDANYRRIVAALLRGEEVEYGFLGVAVDRPSAERLDHGLPITHVTPGTPAAVAGLVGLGQPNLRDRIIAVDGNPIREQDDLFLYVGAALAGTKVTLSVTRGGGPPRQIEVTLAKYVHQMPWVATAKPRRVFGLRVEYSSVLLMQMQNAGDRRITEQGLPPGVLVRDVEPGSRAEAKLKPLGDVANRWLVTHVNNRAVPTPADFYRETAGKDSVTLRLTDPTDPDRDREVTLP